MSPKSAKRAPKHTTLTVLPSPLSPHDSRVLRSGETTYGAFRAASGNATSGVAEVNLSMVDFLDVDSSADWTSIGYDVSGLPGVGSSSSVRLRHCRVSVLEGSILAGVVDSSVGVLAGIRSSEGGFINAPVLASASQTLVLPSSVPRWRTVLEAPLARLAEQGYLALATVGCTEVARLSLVDPDSGDALSDVTVQVRIELAYSASFPLTSSALVLVSSVASPLAVPTGTAVATEVFPRVTGMSNRV